MKCEKQIEKSNLLKLIWNANVIITKYNPYLKGLKKRILKYCTAIMNDAICKTIFTNKYIIS